MKRKKNILKEAFVLLIAVAMFTSTIAVIANTNDENQPVLFTNSSTLNKKLKLQTLDGIVVWDNGMHYQNGLAAQYDISGPMDGYPADDFHFEEDSEVCDVHWIANFYGDPSSFDWCIAFYHDRGDGNAPGDLVQDPHCFDYEEIEMEDLGGGYWEMSVDLPHNKLFEGCKKYWISLWGVGGPFPETRSFWGMHSDPIMLHQAVFKSDHFGYPDWTDTEIALGQAWDMCFQLTTKPCEPSIDIEKYIWDKSIGRWIDADTENSALDLEICTDASFKIVIHNDGECPLIDITVRDFMHDSLKYISADPDPDTFQYTPPEYFMEWSFPGPLDPCSNIEIFITAHVEGPDCSRDYNHVVVEGYSEVNPSGNVSDGDWCWVHAIERSRTVNTPFLSWLQNHLNMFPLLQTLLQRFGLQ